MELPIIESAPVVPEHMAVLRDWFGNQCQFPHVQHYLIGLMVWRKKSLANIRRRVVESADKTQL